MAVGLALKALDAGKVVYYTTRSCLISDLKNARLYGQLERRWIFYLQPSLLVIDEVGYMQLNRQAAELLFCLISECYEYVSVILTSNNYSNDWGELLNDDIIILRFQHNDAPFLFIFPIKTAHFVGVS